MSATPPPSLGLRHLALWIPDAHYVATVAFYREAMGMAVDWEPDADNIYLSGGPDNLALHRAIKGREVDLQRAALDHLGFAVPSAEVVHAWYAHLGPSCSAFGIELLTAPRLHRDGATSFYFRDPAGHRVQILHVPSLRP
ncbi:MAG: VOC family protein [Nannocystaceae bacterium]